MNQEAFEHRVLELWTTTRVPLTKVNLQVLTGVPRAKADAWLDGLVKVGQLELDSDNDGNLFYKVSGTPRSATGPASVAELHKLEALRGTLAPAGASAAVPVRAGAHDEKSLVAAGALSFFLGPVGWLYAAPVLDVVGGVAVWAVLHAILPTFLFLSLLGVAQPLAALVGVLYAWQYNQQGKRTSVKDMGKDKRPKLLR